MKEAFETFLFQKLGLHPSSRILLAVSGGMDSMCMWHLFRRLELNYAIAHCNFLLRAEDSDADEAFVKSYAQGEEVFVRSFDTQTYASEKKLSIQMAARELRYGYFDELMKKEGFEYVATAHHLDDQVETFFVQLVRGGNFPSLSGMPVRTDKVIRPLLFATRDQIEEYIKGHEVPYREDESNQSDAYLRNRIRHNLLPALSKVKPDFQSSILELMSGLREVTDSLEEYFEVKREDVLRRESDGSMRISIEALKNLNFSEYFLETLLRSHGFHRSVAENVIEALDGESGKVFYSMTHRMVKDREDLILQALKVEDAKEFHLLKSELISSKELFFRASLIDNYKGIINDYDKDSALLDYQTLDNEITIRKWKHGDYFHPLGMKGKKKLSDYFVDNKYSLPEKEMQWFMCAGQDIAWIVGKVIDDRFKIRENTKQVLLLELH